MSDPLSKFLATVGLSLPHFFPPFADLESPYFSILRFRGGSSVLSVRSGWGYVYGAYTGLQVSGAVHL